MSKTKGLKKGSAGTKRLSFALDEKSHSWLSMLLDAYCVVDKGVEKAIDSERKRGRKPACTKGCSSCCRTHKDIPVYPLELVGISWYVTEKLSGPQRDNLKKTLGNYKESKPCPFLLEGECSIHPMRPMACRQFNVFGRSCAEDEDPYYTRRDDVLPPVKKHVDQAFHIMLPFYGMENESDRIKAVNSGDMHKIVRRLQDCNWNSLAQKMDEYDRKTREDDTVSR